MVIHFLGVPLSGVKVSSHDETEPTLKFGYWRINAFLLEA